MSCSRSHPGLPLLAVLAIVLRAGAVLAQDPVGGEFQINTYTTSSQEDAAVASAADGRFVVAWTSRYQDGFFYGVFARRFDASGTAQGSDFQVNVFTTDTQAFPSVASAADGRFVVVWHSEGSFQGVFGRRFDAAGNPQGGDFQVNTFVFQDQNHPDVAAAADGSFVVVWQSYNQDGHQRGVFGQRFDAGGTALGGEFQVNAYTTGEQRYPSVGAAADGRFLVAWQSYNQDGSNYGVFARRYDASGNPQGAEFRVNTYTTNHQGRPSVAPSSEGKFVVAWHGRGGQDGYSAGIFAQRYDASGNPVGAEFQVNTYTTGGQSDPAVAMGAAGDFVVTWVSFQDDSAAAIIGQRYDASGTPVGAEFLVNTYTTQGQLGPSVAAAADGRFVVVWDSIQDGDGPGVFGQRYKALDLIFRNGFQTGP